MKVYRCPSDSGPLLTPFRDNFGTSNYPAVCGAIATGSYDPTADYGGMMFQNSHVKFTDVTDGLSNTLMVGERAYDPTGYLPAIWNGMTGYYSDSFGSFVRISDVMYPLAAGSASDPIVTDGGWVSPHSVVINFLAGDGSVHCMPKLASLSWSVKYALGVRDDGDAVSIP